jgi:hypothetical protein
MARAITSANDSVAFRPSLPVLGLDEVRAGHHRT